MRLVAALVVLTVVLAAAVACLGTGRRGWGVTLLVASVLWLPANNRVLEGPVLVRVTTAHGLTTADLVTAAGVVLGALTVWPPSRWRSPGWVLARAAVVVVAVALGYGVSALDTDLRTADRPHRVVRSSGVGPDGVGRSSTRPASARTTHPAGPQIVSIVDTDTAQEVA